MALCAEQRDGARSGACGSRRAGRSSRAAPRCSRLHRSPPFFAWLRPWISAPTAPNRACGLTACEPTDVYEKGMGNATFPAGRPLSLWRRDLAGR